MFRHIAAPDAQLQKLQGCSGNSRESLGALGYEPKDISNFNNLQDAGGPRKTL
jgi:hypothetical protein